MIRMLGREEISEMRTYKKRKMKGFAAIVALISLASLVLPGVALGISDESVSDTLGSAGIHRDFSDEDGFGVGVEITVKQSSPPPTAEPEKPAKTRWYVQPHWVDGGYGVEILKPGYWTEK